MPLLESLVAPSSRGDPESPLRWTLKSVRVLSRELTERNHGASPSKVGELLHDAGYSLQANAKTKEGDSHPDRNAQFERINATAEDFLSRGQPVISVDAKKKESIGERATPGREWQPKKTPIAVEAYDFFGAGRPVAIPYGIYDVAKNLGYVNIGTDHNTPTFAASSIEKWWDRMGKVLYPKATELFVTADSGGSNGFKSHVFKERLQALADKTKLTINVAHFPPGTSKWNKIEHRLFSFVTLNWRGRPLASYEIMVALIAATTTARGLKVQANVDTSKYPLGVSVTRNQLASLNLTRAPFHGEWNYVLQPRSRAQEEAASRPPPRAVTHDERNAYWKEIVRQQVLSGSSGRRFCRERSLNYWTFASAKMRLFGPIRDVGAPSE